MKKVIIIVLAVLLAVDLGLLGFGIYQGAPKKGGVASEAIGGAPAASQNLFGGGTSNEPTVDITVENLKNVSAEDVAAMIINASYNNIDIQQFYFEANVDLMIGNKSFYSDYYRAKNGVNMFYQTLAWTGDYNPVQVKIDYVDQRISKLGDISSFNRETREWFYSVERPSVKSTDLSLPDHTPYNIYSWYDFPLDLGGVKSAIDKTAGRTEAVTGSMIDGSSVKVSEVTDKSGNTYYLIKFNANIANAQASEETMKRFIASSGAESQLSGGVTLNTVSFEVEIWKDAGVFRNISYKADVSAVVSGRNREVTIDKKLSFSYSDNDCSVAARIKNLADTQDAGWISKLSEANQAILQSELEALAAKNPSNQEAAK